MLGSVARKSNLFFAFCLVILCSVTVAGVINLQAYAQSTSVNAVICAASPSIVIAEPSSDSVITEPMVVFRGTVSQASQIVIEIDGQYAGVEPLNVGQLSYDVSTQLPRGTHTVTLTAVNSCGGANTSASSVVTFTPPPSTPSDGGATPTGVNDGTQPQDGVTISGEAVDPMQSPSSGILPSPVAEAFNGVLEWLNIAQIDHSDDTADRMSMFGAVTITVGTYIATIGGTRKLITHVASMPWFVRYKKKDRYKIAVRGFRIFGVLLIIIGFFL